jgi:hypothetical protein
MTFAIFIIGFGVMRIICTYHILNHTWDEPQHIACGMEWLDKGEYTLNPVHPPLARVAVALGPFIDGIRSPGKGHQHKDGLEIIYSGGSYFRNLSLARFGVIPFFFFQPFLYLYGPASALEMRPH